MESSRERCPASKLGARHLTTLQHSQIAVKLARVHSPELGRVVNAEGHDLVWRRYIPSVGIPQYPAAVLLKGRYPEAHVQERLGAVVWLDLVQKNKCNTTQCVIVPAENGSVGQRAVCADAGRASSCRQRMRIHQTLPKSKGLLHLGFSCV